MLCNLRSSFWTYNSSLLSSISPTLTLHFHVELKRKAHGEWIYNQWQVIATYLLIPTSWDYHHPGNDYARLSPRDMVTNRQLYSSELFTEHENPEPRSLWSCNGWALQTGVFVLSRWRRHQETRAHQVSREVSTVWSKLQYLCNLSLACIHTSLDGSGSFISILHLGIFSHHRIILVRGFKHHSQNNFFVI